MADYLCKNCPHNKNGWCPKKKIQGLKQITQCEHFPVIKEKEEMIYVHALDEKPMSGAYEELGKREMFHNIQMQMLAIDKKENEEDKFKILKQVMVGLEQTLQIGEQIHGIAVEYMVTQDMIDNSKKISQYWFETVGKYEEK